MANGFYFVYWPKTMRSITANTHLGVYWNAMFYGNVSLGQPREMPLFPSAYTGGMVLVTIGDSGVIW